MKDSINQKAQQRERTNKWWKQATTVMALWLTSPVGDHKLNKRHSESSGRGEVQISSSEISAKNEHCSGITVRTVHYYAIR